MTALLVSRKSQLFLLGFLTSIFLVNFLSRVILAPLMPVIEKDLGLGHTAAGVFFMMMAMGYAAGLIGSGFLSARINHRRTIALAAVACGCAFFLIAASHTLWMIRLGLFLIGVSTGIYLPSGITTITSSFQTAQWGRALSVHELAPSLAFISAPLIAEALLLLFPWQGVLVLIGGVAVAPGPVLFPSRPGGRLPGRSAHARVHPSLVRQTGPLDHGRPVQPRHHRQHRHLQHDSPLPRGRAGYRPEPGEYAPRPFADPRPPRGARLRLDLGPHRPETDDRRGHPLQRPCGDPPRRPPGAGGSS